MEKRRKEQFLLFPTIFCCLLVALCVKTGTRFSLRDKRLFEISEFEITTVDCLYVHGGHLGHVTMTNYINFCSHKPKMFHMKFDFNQLSG